MTANIALRPIESDVLDLAERMLKVGIRDTMRAFGGSALFLPQGSVGLGHGFLSLNVFILRHIKSDWCVAVTWGKDGQRRVTWGKTTRRPQ